MPKRYRLIIACLLLLVAQAAYGSGFRQYYDRFGNPTVDVPLSLNGALSPETARTSVPEGIDLPAAEVSYRFYPVAGATYSEVLTSVEERSPGGRRNPAQLEWYYEVFCEYDISSEVDEEEAAVHAAIENYRIRVSYPFLMTLPTLIDPTGLTAVELGLWQQFVRGIINREVERIGTVRDQETRKAFTDTISDISYLILDYREGATVEAEVERFIRSEANTAMKEMVRAVQDRLAGRGAARQREKK